MNVDLLRKVADAIELHDRFDIMQVSTGSGDLVHDCDTIGCVAGWVNAVTGNYGGNCEDAGHALDLAPEQWRNLFYLPNGERPCIWTAAIKTHGFELDPTPVEAAKMLRWIADGEVTL